MQLITGNTYPVKQQLKALGGTWNSAAQGWDVPDSQAESARAIVLAAGPSTYRPKAHRAARRHSPSYRPVQQRGRCIDAPCCGCCD